MSGVVEARGVAVTLGGRVVVRDVDLVVQRGEFVALMGPNGSGKSTLVRALTGLRPVSQGSVELFGTPLARFRERHRIGFVPQRVGASSGVPASVREVVAAGRISRRRLLRGATAADRAAIADALDVVGLADLAGETVTALSGGQQQRVLIARALASQPELLFLDEPTVGVDLAHQRAFAETLAELSERGTTIVLVAHELGVVEPLIDRCVVMRHGEVAYDGPALSELEAFGVAAGLGPHAHSDAAHHGHPHTPGPHECPPGHSDTAPEVAGPLDREPEARA